MKLQNTKNKEKIFKAARDLKKKETDYSQRRELDCQQISERQYRKLKDVEEYLQRPENWIPSLSGMRVTYR